MYNIKCMLKRQKPYKNFTFKTDVFRACSVKMSDAMSSRNASLEKDV